METFIITQQHINLLQNAYVRWNDMEFGAPGIDPKMPYGHSMNIYGDIAGIIGLMPTVGQGDEDEGYSNEQIAWMDKLHRETLTVLEIVLETGILQTGTYTRESHTGYWMKITE